MGDNWFLRLTDSDVHSIKQTDADNRMCLEHLLYRYRYSGHMSFRGNPKLDGVCIGYSFNLV